MADIAVWIVDRCSVRMRQSTHNYQTVHRSRRVMLCLVNADHNRCREPVELGWRNCTAVSVTTHRSSFRACADNASVMAETSLNSTMVPFSEQVMHSSIQSALC